MTVYSRTTTGGAMPVCLGEDVADADQEQGEAKAEKRKPQRRQREAADESGEGSSRTARKESGKIFESRCRSLGSHGDMIAHSARAVDCETDGELQ